MSDLAFDAIVLAGGASIRLDGTDKALLEIDGETMLDSAFRAVGRADRIICVGPERPTGSRVIWTREDPPGSGPVAAIAAGLEQTTRPVAVVLAVDMPFVTENVVGDLVNACTRGEAAAVIDETGRIQPLAAAYRVHDLRSRLTLLGHEAGAAVKDLLCDVDWTVVDQPDAAMDVDTWDELWAVTGRGGEPNG